MWKDLSMKERASLIKLGVDNGIYNLNEIRDSYNQYAEGGPIKSYYDFANRLSKAWNNQDISKDDYDYEKYYYDNPEEAYRQLVSIEKGGTGHFPDEGESGIYKTPNHPTYPDLGVKSWSDNDRVFHISDRQAYGDTDRILDYLGSDLDYNNGATRVMHDNAYILPSVTISSKGSGYTDLVPNIKHTGYVYSDSPVASRKYEKGGHLFAEGGWYEPSEQIKAQITEWEGKSMYAPAPDTKKVNRPFSAETKDFNRALPKGAEKKLNQTQLDGLYSYSYNVGVGHFRKRVVPTLTKYLNGTATIKDVQKSMWATGDNDKKRKGLAKRRAKEREMFGRYTPVYRTEISPRMGVPAKRLVINPLEKTSLLNSIDRIPYDRSDVSLPLLNFDTQQSAYDDSYEGIKVIYDLLTSIKSPNRYNTKK